MFDEKEHRIEITHTDSGDKPWMVEHEGHHKWFKDWGEMMGYLIKWRTAKELS